MKIYRTKVNQAISDWLGSTADMLENVYDWVKVEHDEEDGNYIRFYISNTIYIEMSKNADGNYKLSVNDATMWDDNLEIMKVGYTYHNMSVCVGDGYIGISVGTSNGLTWYYSNNYSVIIDTFDDVKDGIAIKSKMVVVKKSPSAYVADGYTAKAPVYVPYTSGSNAVAGSYHSAYLTSQFVPFVNCLSGKQADNLNYVLITSQQNSIVDDGSDKWLITDWFALPCGNKIEYVRM